MPIIPILFLILLFNYPENAQAIRDTSTARLQNYIIHVRQPEGRVFENSDDLRSWHESFLSPSRTDSLRGERILYSYQNVISGFAARLTEEEVRAVEKKNGFVSAQAERVFHPLTTHSPEFLGLNQNTGFWNDSNFGKGVIIGVLDTGIFPTHPSFSDTGVPPPPAKWKGRCDFNASVCNNKLIGARTFNLASMARRGEGKAAEPPLDNDGHGTHTASTAAGAFVQNAGALGNAEGTAVGMAPYAHLASYKVCFEDCPESDILAALDAAVYDGVDVISMSIGGGSLPFFNDSIAIGSFAAVQKGIFVSCAAGNGGPFNSTLSNEAPWILTVGASTINRKIVAAARLGDGEEFDGESLFQPKNFPSTLLPLVYAGMNSSKPESALCGEGALKGLDVKGKVVVCDRGGGIARLAKGQEVKNAGGAAMILANDEADGYSTIADVHVLPAAHVSFAAGQKIKAYINSTHTPTATILFKGTSIGDTLSPVVASFSSRGPNLASPGILKPDIIGPGVSILAAWPFSLDNSTSSKLTFNFESGTSMACPHLSGIAALLKSSHPDWSPAAIKSALMTSANIVNSEGNPIVDQTLQPADIFATGSGHVDPSKASEPGLIYDIQPDDYIPYLCGLGYKDHEVSIIAHRTISCNTTPSMPEGELNYPSFSVKLGSSQTFSRTVTNVGHAKSSYIVTIVSPPGVDVTVNPPTLYFSEVNQKATYSVTFTRSSQGGTVGTFAQGYITWNFAKNSVRSPISVTFE